MSSFQRLNVAIWSTTRILGFFPTSLRTLFSFCRVCIQLRFFSFSSFHFIYSPTSMLFFIPPSLSHSLTLCHLGSYLSLPLSLCCHNPKLPAGAGRARRSVDVSLARPGQASSSFLAVVKPNSSQPAVCSCLAVRFSDSMWIWNYMWEGWLQHLWVKFYVVGAGKTEIILVFGECMKQREKSLRAPVSIGRTLTHGWLSCLATQAERGLGSGNQKMASFPREKAFTISLSASPAPTWFSCAGQRWGYRISHKYF